VTGVNFLQELGKFPPGRRRPARATAYTTDSGASQPTDIITALVAAAGTVPLIAPATAETLIRTRPFSVASACQA
jgi:hypothetical protein